VEPGAGSNQLSTALGELNKYLQAVAMQLKIHMGSYFYKQTAATQLLIIESMR